MSWLALLAVASIVNLLIAELFDWCPWLAERLIRRAAGKLPIGARERYLDEWLAELEAVPGRRISSLIFAVQILVRASKVCEEIAGRPAPSVDVFGVALKRAFDAVFSGFVLLLISPVLLCASLVVRGSTPGALLVRQRRVGRDGKEFDLYKFRTTPMEPNEPGPLEYLLGGDTAPGGVEVQDCHTRAGRFLRRSGLDELPQLFNVLRGDMSLIGPRPERPEFVELFRQDIVRYGDRHRVKSGITGWAQVHGLRGQTSLAERVEWDNYYIAHWSLGLDVKILALTVAAVFRNAE